MALGLKKIGRPCSTPSTPISLVMIVKTKYDSLLNKTLFWKYFMFNIVLFNLKQTNKKDLMVCIRGNFTD